MPTCSWPSLRSNPAGTRTPFPRAGAIGLGQLMPGTAAGLGVNPHDPAQNISGAARYLRGLVGRFGTKHYDLVFARTTPGRKQ